MTADEARAYLSRLSSHRGRAGDTDYLNPELAVRLATAIQQARAEGIPASLTSGFREEGQTGSAYDAGGNSSHSYGLAVDIGGLDGPDGPLTSRWARIAQENGLSNPYGTGNAAEFNHWQLPSQPLERTPQLLAALRQAKATGDFNQVWAAYSPQSAGGGTGRYTADQVFNAILQQESGGDMHAPTSSAGAVGPMQITRPTFALYAQPGEDINDPATNIAVGHRIINDLMTKYNNDPARVAVAYFSGEGNVAKEGGASPFLKDSNDGSKKVSGYVSDVMRRLGAPGTPNLTAGGGSATPAQTPPPNPWAGLGASLGEALGGMSGGGLGGGGGFVDPPDQPAIRTPALGADFTPPPADPVPQNLAAGAGSSMGSTLASLAIPPGTDTLDPSITQGAPSMTSMLGSVGTSSDPTLNDPRRGNAINPYARPMTRLG